MRDIDLGPINPEGILPNTFRLLENRMGVREAAAPIVAENGWREKFIYLDDFNIDIQSGWDLKYRIMRGLLMQSRVIAEAWGGSTARFEQALFDWQREHPSGDRASEISYLIDVVGKYPVSIGGRQYKVLVKGPVPRDLLKKSGVSDSEISPVGAWMPVEVFKVVEGFWNYYREYYRCDSL